MKKKLLIVPALLFSMLGFSQGIVFEKGSWKEVLEKAQQTNKPIFVDVYTSWCGPCKTMSKDIFPLESVGKVYNENFICYQIDAEKGEGIKIAKMYAVNAYPTYLFIKSDGTCFYRALGSMEAKKFIAVTKTAKLEYNDPKTLDIWEKEYVDKKNDPTFLINYMNKRSKLGLPNASLFDEYLKLIPESDRTSDIVVKIYQKEGRTLKVNSFAYENLQKNSVAFFSKMYATVNSYLLNGIMNTILEASKSKDEKLLAMAISSYDQIPNITIYKYRDELYMEYYNRTGETDNYMKYATNLCDNQLMKISVDSILKKDEANFSKIKKQIDSGALASMDSSMIAQMKSLTEHIERDRISQTLNNIAWNVLINITDTNKLQKALDWSKRSLELRPEYPAYLNTYEKLRNKLNPA